MAKFFCPVSVNHLLRAILVIGNFLIALKCYGVDTILISVKKKHVENVLTVDSTHSYMFLLTVLSVFNS